MLKPKEILPLHIRLLQLELDRRKSVNSQYSLRAFAAALDWHPSALSRILAGKQELSIPSCTDALKALRISRPEAQLFLASVAQDKCNRAGALLTRALIHEYGEVDDERSEMILNDFLRERVSLNRALAFSKDLISVMDLKWRFLQASDSLAVSVNKIPCELIGLHWKESGFAPDFVLLLENQQAIAEKSSVETNFRFVIGTGSSTKFYHRLVIPTYQVENLKQSYISYIRDVTWETFTLNAVSKIHSSVVKQVTFQSIAEAGIPMLGKACVLQVYGIDGTLTAVSAAHETASKNVAFLNSVSLLTENFQTSIRELLQQRLEYKVSLVDKKIGEFKVGLLINIQLEIKGKALGILTYISQPKTELSEDETFAISKIRIAASQAIDNAMASG